MRSSLVERTVAYEAKTYPRPVPRGRPARAGTFGDNFDAQPNERAAVVKVSESAAACLARLRDAPSDEGAKTAACVTVGGARPAADALLDLGRSERAGTPSASGAFFSVKSKASPIQPILALCKHSAASVLGDALLGHADAAAERCVATLEVVRDYLDGGAIIAAAAATTCVEQMEAPCERALTAVSEDKRGPLRTDIGAVVSSLPPFSDAVDAEWLRTELMACGTYIEPSARSKIGPRGTAIVKESDEQFQALPKSERSLHRKLCLDGHDAMAVLSQAFHAPEGSPERARLLADYEKRKETALAIITPDKFETRYDAMRSTLEKLAKP